MNLSTNPLFTHGFDKLCTICHKILKDPDSSHSIFSTLEELESPGPMNVLQVLQSFSNFNFYNGPQMVCTMCYDKTIDVYKFIQICNKAHENMQHYLKNVKDKLDVDVKIEEISIAPARIIVDGREFLEMQNEKVSKFDELGMVISGTDIKIEGMEEEETCNNEEVTISDTEIVTEEKTGSTDFANLRLERINAQMHDERISLIKCNACDLVFSEKKDLDNHLQEGKRTKEQPFLSEVRHALFGTKYNLRSHDERHISKDLWHSISIDSQPLKDHETNVVCLECQEVFYNDKQLKIHMRRSHKKTFLCKDCGKVFTTISRFNTHSRVHTGEKSFTRGFAAPSSSGRHTNSHNVVKAYKCEQCDRRFSQAGNLRSHMDIHTGVKAHNCEQCNRQFTHASSLRRHMDIHNGVKAHKCEKCDRRFTQASALRTHMDIHNGVKAHKCEQCDRRFSDASNLRRHVDTHNGVKAHKCEQCDRRFSDASNLRSHMDMHNGVKAHRCEQCDRRFTHASSLHRHIMTHSRKICTICNKAFDTSNALKVHFQSHNIVKEEEHEQIEETAEWEDQQQVEDD